MKLWTEVRRRVLTGEISKREACRQYELHWDTLQKILTHTEPPGYRRTKQRASKLDPFRPVIEQILQEDQQNPPKQRHSARRIFERLCDEYGYDGGLTIVQEAVKEARQQQREVFLPLAHPPGEAQVDYGFAQVDLQGERVQVALFVMSLPYSDALYLQAFPRECTETFLEGHRRAFEFFEGVPNRISYDNSKIAVARITGSRERVVTHAFQRLQSHYLFAEHFCRVRRPQEKGHVERLLEFARRNFLVPIPRVDSLQELNQRLETACERDLARQLRGQSRPKAEMLIEDQQQFLGLPRDEFESHRVVSTRSNSLSLVRFDGNDYSVPTEFAHRELTVIATVDEVRLVHGQRLVARHARCWQKEQTFFDPVHYLALLERKPGGLDHARPLEDWELPDCFEVLRRRLETRLSGMGTREFIRVLRLLESHSLSELTDAVQQALEIEALSVDGIRLILEYQQEEPLSLFSLDGRPHLEQVRVSQTDVSAYQTLLTQGEVR